MLRIGLTGGIGSGKSTVARTFAELGATIVDADVIAREVVEPGTPGLAGLVEAFGDDILLPDGRLDRPALAAKAFTDDESRATLNAIVHPLVGARTAELIDSAPEDAIVVQDIPLLVEGGMAPLFHLVVVVFTDESVRLRRLVDSRGLDEADAKARIAAQATDVQRREVADIALDNNGSPETLVAAVRQLWSERLEPFAANLRAGVPAAPPLIVREPRAEWARRAERRSRRLRLIGGDEIVDVEHVGPTVVDGMPARDVVDLVITAESAEHAAAVADRLPAAGFPRVGADIAGFRRLWGPVTHASADPEEQVTITIGAPRDTAVHTAHVVRDRLRTDGDSRLAYLALERRAAAAADRADDPRAAFGAVIDDGLPGLHSYLLGS
ncbi:dephospho-CoA kinase [Millisia brevis]|uniref:dephospho-CoA kinase n=1 Tax=Millisia brevis TaxID=264148 RepID=UPI0008300BDE|nr:dephospho-CoA kinase [Millisia brevis]